MNTTYIEPTEHTGKPCCTREQAARLLEELRRSYRSLSNEKRDEIRSHLSELADAQQSIEGEES